MSVGVYHAREYQPQGDLRTTRKGGSKSIIFKDEHIDTLADCLPKLFVSICNTGTGAGCVIGAFRLSPLKSSGRQDCISARNKLAYRYYTNNILPEYFT